MTRWMLTEGDYSAYGMVGAIADEAAARRLEKELAATSGHHDYQVEEVAELDDLTVHTLTHYARQDIVAFDGSAGGGYDEPEEKLWTNAHVGALPDYKPVKVQEFGATYGSGTREPGGMRLSVRLSVTGIDIERCRKVWNEQHAQLLAAPLDKVVAYWAADLKRGHHTDGGAFYLDHPDNAPIAPLIRQALA